MAGGAKTVPRLTDTIIRATTKTVWDSDLRGFGVRVSGNTKTFIVLIASGRRQKIGRYPLVSLAKARDEAKRILAEKELGTIKPTFTAYADAKEAYLRDCEARNKASTVFGYRFRLDTCLNFDRKNLADITPRDITEKLAALDHAPQEKRYAFVVARAFFNWCVKHYYLDSSPIGRLPAPAKGKPRERTLHPSELKAIYNACHNDPFGASTRLMVLTGQRRGEIAHITHENGVASLLARYTKNGRAHSFPITPRIAELLSHDRTFNGWGKAKARLDKISGVTDWTLHDLRRTYATVLAELGTAPHVIEKLLNHVTGTISGVSAIYNRHKYFEEQKTAVEAFEHWFRGLLDDPCV